MGYADSVRVVPCLHVANVQTSVIICILNAGYTPHDNRQNKGDRNIEESESAYAGNKDAKGINACHRMFIPL